MTNFATMAMAYYRTPVSQGGSSYGTTNWTDEYIAKYIGVKYDWTDNSKKKQIMLNIILWLM